MRIALIVGEISGDKLGANLIESLRQHYPNLQVEGILGPELIRLGYESLYPMERLSIMGFIEPIKRLPELIRLYHNILHYFTQNPPDVFIGIDAPDFNLRIEKKLRAKGIKTVHYVSPTVWAWRQGRIHNIKKSIDLMLSIFPFEIDLYKKYKIPIQFCGHPLADQIPLENDQEKAKTELKVTINNDNNNINNISNINNINKINNTHYTMDILTKTILTILPGSRQKEIDYLAEIYLQTALKCYQQYPNLYCVIPVVSQAHKEKIESLHQKICPQLPLSILVSNTHLALAAADVVLVTSGTATLEAMLHKKPMIVAYKANFLCYYLVKLLIKVPYISQPNLLANENIVPEFIQTEVTAENLSKSILERLEPSFNKNALIEKFVAIHKKLKQNAGQKAAEAVAQLIANR